jgi:hypothetical protein
LKLFSASLALATIIKIVGEVIYSIKGAAAAKFLI